MHFIQERMSQFLIVKKGTLFLCMQIKNIFHFHTNEAYDFMTYVHAFYLCSIQNS